MVFWHAVLDVHTDGTVRRAAELGPQADTRSALQGVLGKPGQARQAVRHRLRTFGWFYGHLTQCGHKLTEITFSVPRKVMKHLKYPQLLHRHVASISEVKPMNNEAAKLAG